MTSFEWFCARRLSAAGVAVLAIGGCGGDAAQPSPPPSPPVVTVTIAGPASLSFGTLQRTVTLSAAVTATSGVPPTVSWSSSNTGVAEVTLAGQVTAIGNGPATILARAGSGSATVSVAVNQVSAKLLPPSDPGPAAAGIPWLGPVAVAIADSGGALATNAFDIIGIRLGDNPAGGVLTGTLSRPAVAGIARFERLTIDAAGTGYSLVATAAFGTATGAPFTVLPGPDLVRFHNVAGDSVGALLDGNAGIPVNDVRSVSADSSARAVLGRALQGSNEIVAFTRGRPPMVSSNVAWTEAVDTIDVAFRDPIRIPITVWVIVGPLDAETARTADALLTTAAIWNAERMGVAVGTVTINDASTDPDAASLRATTECQQQTAAETLIGRTAGQINIYLVDVVDGFAQRGYSCGSTNFMAGAARADLWAHEIGHSFGLGHVDGLPTFGQTNVMHSASNTRQYLTEGQVFRSHHDRWTALRLTYGIVPGVARDCPGQTVNVICIPLETRLWSDGPTPPGGPAAVNPVEQWLQESCAVGADPPERRLRVERPEVVEGQLLDAFARGPTTAWRAEIERAETVRLASLRRFTEGLRPGDPLLRLAALLPDRDALEAGRRAVAQATLRYREAAVHGLGLIGGNRSAALLGRLSRDPTSPFRPAARAALAARVRPSTP